MKFTLSWLKDYLDTNASVEEISVALTSLGLEVEGIEDRSVALAPFIIAEILEAEKHPQADKLRVCKVNNGTETLQIVCGAPNARAGIKVILAPIGSEIPTNGLIIKASEIRGVKSNGMLCSAAGLGLSSDAEGIVELPLDAPVGKSFAKTMGYDDPIIEIAITPNRGDCLGVYGIARDLAAKGIGKLKPLNVPKVAGKGASPISVKVDAEGAFLGRHFKNVKNGESPEWLKKRLTAIGSKPISALVDITNYLSFTYGRPAHKFDAAKIGKQLTMRMSKAGEKFTALDNKEYVLQDGHYVIADENASSDQKVQAIGGVMGGLNSGVSAETTDAFLEIAWFNPETIAKAGRAYQIDSDARYRFERTVDVGFLESGIALASQLVLDLCGGEPSEIVSAGKVETKREPIAFDFGYIKAYSGVEIAADKAKEILKNLGFTVEEKQVTPPSFRPDISIKQDVVEEVIRVNGYEHIPTLKLPEFNQPTLTLEQQKRFTARRLLANRGLKEAVTYSFVSEKEAALFAANQNLAKLQNPISSELSIMRPSALPHLVTAVASNAARSLPNNQLFEIGPVFKGEQAGEQEIAASGVRSGNVFETSPHGKAKAVDLFQAKADAIAVLSQYVDTANLQVTRNTPSYYHPGRSGALALGPNVLAYFGELHPATLKQLDVDVPTVAFEVFLDRAPKAKAKKNAVRAKFEPSNLQPVDRDFAFVVDEKVLAVDIVKAAKKAEKQLVQSVSVFDVFAGKSMIEGKKSVAITVRIQPQLETLKDEEIEKISQSIIAEVMKATGGTLRE